MTEYFELLGRRFVPESSVAQYWRHKDDIELWGRVRDVVSPDNSNALPGAPAVFVLHESSTEITREWQNYLIDINPGMARRHVAALLGDKKAFTNFNGFGNPSDLRANWIVFEDLTAPFPKFDKSRTCARSIFKGAVDGAFLVPDMLDGNNPPPPVTEVNPQSHPHLFFAANNVSSGGSVFPFANGGLYSCTPEPTRPFSFLPHVVRFLSGANPVRIPLANLVAMAGVPSPYIER